MRWADASGALSHRKLAFLSKIALAAPFDLLVQVLQQTLTLVPLDAFEFLIAHGERQGVEPRPGWRDTAGVAPAGRQLVHLGGECGHESLSVLHFLKLFGVAADVRLGQSHLCQVIRGHRVYSVAQPLILTLFLLKVFQLRLIGLHPHVVDLIVVGDQVLGTLAGLIISGERLRPVIHRGLAKTLNDL